MAHKHLLLLGDSVFDNQAYVAQGRAVVERNIVSGLNHKLHATESSAADCGAQHGICKRKVQN